MLFDAVKDADPELAVTAIEFWLNFITIESVIYKEEFKKKLFEQ